ncbi:MAG: DUF1450 domain-containing protein [Culicoidibacterales bacterium]
MAKSIDDVLAAILGDQDEIRICDKCKGTNVQTLLPKLKAIAPEAKYAVGCQSFCGPGRKKPFAIVNDKAILAPTEDELVAKVAKELK